MKKEPKKKKWNKSNKENCLQKMVGDRFSNVNKSTVISPRPFVYQMDSQKATPATNYTNKSYKYLPR